MFRRRSARFALAGLLFASACEPPFIDACQNECACTGDSFACTAPRSGGCDNAHRREWTLASQAGCESEYLAWFDCYHSRSVCSTGAGGAKVYGPPAGACDSVRAAYTSCG
jgi:hypothetical protein